MAKRGRMKRSTRQAIDRWIRGHADNYDRRLICWSFLNDGCEMATQAVIDEEMPFEKMLEIVSDHWEALRCWAADYMRGTIL